MCSLPMGLLPDKTNTCSRSLIVFMSGGLHLWSGAYQTVSGNTRYMRAYVKFQAVPTADGKQQFPLFFGQSSNGSALAYGGIYRQSGVNYWAIWYISTSTTLTYNVSTTAYSTGWHCLELAINRASSKGGWVKFWLDGTLLLSSRNLNNTGRTLSYARVGFSYSDGHVFLKGESYWKGASSPRVYCEFCYESLYV